MPDLAFEIRGAEAMRAVAAPALALHLEISSKPPEAAIQSIILNCQIQIEAARRRYDPGEQQQLRDLFGEPERWGQTLRPLLWTNLTTTVPGFSGSVCIDLAIPCTLDFNVTATKYFHGVNGAAPLTVLFSGTVFYRGEANELQAAPIPWRSEARFSLPADVWKQAIELQHSNTRWLALRRDVFERLYDFKVAAGLATFDDAVERIIEHAMKVGA
jgi:hypothetical protein